MIGISIRVAQLKQRFIDFIKTIDKKAKKEYNIFELKSSLVLN